MPTDSSHQPSSPKARHRRCPPVVTQNQHEAPYAYMKNKLPNVLPRSVLWEWRGREGGGARHVTLVHFMKNPTIDRPPCAPNRAFTLRTCIAGGLTDNAPPQSSLLPPTRVPSTPFSRPLPTLRQAGEQNRSYSTLHRRLGVVRMRW